MKTITIDKAKCIKCGICNKVCILTKFCGFEKIEDAAEAYCIGCGHCITACPKDAISHKSITTTKKINDIPDFEKVKNLIMKTRSLRDFKAKKLEENDIKLLLELSKYTQSGLNSKNIKIMLIQDENQLFEIKNAVIQMYDLITAIYNLPFIKHILKIIIGDNNFKSLKFEAETHIQREKAFKQGKDTILYNAPALLIFIAPKNDLIAIDNASIMAQNILLGATSLNLGGCYMGCITTGCRELKYKPLLKTLNLPENYTVFQALILGYPSFQFNKMPER